MTSLLIISCLLTANFTWGFQQSQLLPTFRIQPSSLALAKRPPPSNNNKSNKSNNDKSKGGNNNANSKRPAAKKSAPNAASTGPQEKSPGRQHQAPPWQVLSQKDANKNAAVEKKRRDRIAQGLPEDLDNQEEEKVHQQQAISNAFLDQADKSFLSWKRFSPASVACDMKFVAAVLDRKLPPRLGVPEIAFLGRSNVGKSSLLNRLSSVSNNNDEARVGKTPGATASVNLYAFYDKNKQSLLGFVDLPGFGYARLSKEIQESVQQTAERYLGSRKELVLGILLVDIRREPTEDDRIVLAALYDMGVPIVVVATKVDKVSKTELVQNLETIRDGLGLPEGQPLCVSSVTGEGTKALWNVIMEGAEMGVKDYRKTFLRGQVDENRYDNGQEFDMDEDGEAVYSQGFDWVQGEAYDDEILDDDFEEDDNLDNDHEEEMPMQKVSFKELKKKAKQFERDNKL
jgi:GTP-binding protein